MWPRSIGQKCIVLGKEELSLLFSSLVAFNRLHSVSCCLDEEFGSSLDAITEQVEAELKV